MNRKGFIRRCFVAIFGVGFLKDKLPIEQEYPFLKVSNFNIPVSPYITDPDAWFLKHPNSDTEFIFTDKYLEDCGDRLLVDFVHKHGVQSVINNTWEIK